MNCFPTAKIISGKTKTKYSLSATQKYEQRIQDSKFKKEFPQCGMKSVKPEIKKECLFNQNVDDWVNKRKEIDKWRKSVLSAMLSETNSASSNNDSDSHFQPDSSTLTNSSTLRSTIDFVKRDLCDKQDILTPTTEEKCYNLQNSPSIPLFQSNFKNNTNGNMANNANLFYEFYLRQDYDSKKSAVDDDDVFSPSDSPNDSRGVGFAGCEVSPHLYVFPSFNDSMTNTYQDKHYQNRLIINTKVMPHSTEVSSNYRTQNQVELHDSQSYKWRNQSYVYQNEKHCPVDLKNINDTAYKNHNYRSYDYNNHEKVCSYPKKTLHKNETNAKIVLRPLDSNCKSSNNPHSGTFMRTRSLNIKRLTYNADQYNHRPTLLNNCETTNERFQRKYYTNIFESSHNNRNQTSSGSSKCIVLKPTFSQENVSYSNDRIRTQNPSMLKISSYNNLQFPTDKIPKVSIDEPLTVKFVFGSEPSLSRNF